MSPAIVSNPGERDFSGAGRDGGKGNVRVCRHGGVEAGGENDLAVIGAGQTAYDIAWDILTSRRGPKPCLHGVLDKSLDFD